MIPKPTQSDDQPRSNPKRAEGESIMKCQDTNSRPRSRWASSLLAAAALLAAGTAAGGEIGASVRDTDGQPIAEAVVVAVPHGAMPAITPPTVVVDQIDKEFVQYIQPVLVGSPVIFPNKDDIRHHVYSFSPAKVFELPLYSGTPANPVVFDKPGVVVVGCNIHDWMLGFIYVSETPYFGKTSDAGSLQLSHLPPGEYTVRVWHPRMTEREEATGQNVTISGDERKEVTWQLKLKRELRIRRAPMGGRNSYR
jgi:hypothetical protein